VSVVYSDVYVTRHAVDRAMERLADSFDRGRSWPGETMRDWLRRETAAAIEDGVSMPGGETSRGLPAVNYQRGEAWLVVAPGDPGGPPHTLVTVLGPGDRFILNHHNEKERIA